MPTGKQGAPTGLAKQFAEFVDRTMSDRKWTFDYLAANMSMSRNYLYVRVTQKSVFTLRDFEEFAQFLGMDPQELLARVRLPEAAEYDGRLIPGYEVVSTASGKRVYLVEDATPGRRDDTNVTVGRFGKDRVGPVAEDLGEVAAESEVDHDGDHDDYTP